MRKKVKELLSYNYLENSFFGQDMRYTWLIAIMCFATALLVAEIIYF